jgi:hypothetical protein
MQPDLEHFAERLVSGMSEAVVFADFQLPTSPAGGPRGRNRSHA